MTATEARPLAPGAVHRELLANGLTVLVRRDTTAPVVAIVTYVKAGYFDETDDVVGIAHVLEHMFFKGTARRGVGEIAKETKASGGYLNAHTIYDHTSYYTVLPSSSFEAGLDIQFDAYANSVIDAAELAKELEVIIQEANRKADNPSAVATETLYEVLHDRHRMRRWRIGREAGLRALGREQMLEFYRNFYRPSSTILSVVGDIDVDEALRQIERRYGAIPAGEPHRMPGPAEPESRGFRYRELAGDIAQTQIVFGWRTPGSLDPDTIRLELAAAVLGTGRASRLYRAVRERQLASSVSAYDYTPTEIGVFVAHAEAKPETARDAARAIWAQLGDVRDRGIDAEEIERARRVYESQWVRRLESMDGQANHLAEWEALGGWTLADEYFERLMSTPASEVNDALRRHLDPDRAAAVVYRPASAPEIASGPDDFRAMLDRGAVAPIAGGVARTPAPPAPPLRPARFEDEQAGVRVYRTATGVPILVRQRAGAPIVNLGVFSLGGARDEGVTRAGLTTLLGRTAVKGTARRSAEQIAEDAELLGGSVAASIGSESFGWTLSVPTRHVAAAIDLLGDVVQHATIPDAALETERAIALADVASLRDDMYRYPMRLATEAAFAGHPYATSALGGEESLRSITADDVRRWHATRVLGAPSVIAIVGDVDPDAIAAIAAREFGELRLGESEPIGAPEWPSSPVLAVEERDKAQSALALLFPGPARPDPARFAAQLLATIASGLGGRFFDELRDRQSLAYTVHAFASERTMAGAFVAYIATSPEKEEIARRGLLAEFAKLREQPVTDDELARAKTYTVGTHAIRQQSGGAVMGDVLDSWLFGHGLHELDEYIAHIRAVTAADIQALARKYFDEGRVVEGVVRGRGLRS